MSFDSGEFDSRPTMILPKLRGRQSRVGVRGCTETNATHKSPGHWMCSVSVAVTVYSASRASPMAVVRREISAAGITYGGIR